MTAPLLEISGLKTIFQTDEGTVKAVDGVDLHLHRKETLGLVGESGCGKSVTSLSIMRLIPDPPGKISDGEIRFNGRNLLELSEKEMQAIRGKDIAMIFQEPMTSLNPVFTIGDQIIESLVLHESMSKKEAKRRAVEVLSAVSIPDPAKRFNEYPHQLSGGMRQRVMIAMALACNPSLLIADEPTTALDVTIQAQIMDLLESLKDQFDLSILLITHDLGVVAEVADRVAVMYAGRIVETADVMTLFTNPLHPYTRGLLRSVPKLHEESDDFKRRKLETIDGSVPNLAELPPGCAFKSRCTHATHGCDHTDNLIFHEVETGHFVRCVMYDEKQ